MRLSHGYLPLRGKPLNRGVPCSAWALPVRASGGAGAKKKGFLKIATVLRCAGREPRAVSLSR